MKSKYTSKVIILLIIMCMLAAASTIAFADDGLIPNINVSIGGGEGSVADSIQVIILLTVLALAPSILIMMTSFTRIIIILSFVRRALSLQSTPPNQVLIALALFLTFFIMSPVFTDVYANAYEPLAAGEISQEEAYNSAIEPFREFMFKQVSAKDLQLFVNIAGVDKPQTVADIPTEALIPAFILSELTIGFKVGLLLFLPFVVIDMIVASTLMALGMMMLPPVMVSLPFKILLFILVDGWNLIVEMILKGFR